MDAQAQDRPIVRHLAARVRRFVTRALGSSLLFVVAAAVTGVTNLDRPWVRNFAAHRINAMLAPSFRGRVRVEHIGGLSLLGVSDTNVTIFDPTGSPVLIARGIRVRVAAWAVARSALFDRSSPLSVRLPSVSIDTLDVRLDADREGALDLVDAFSTAAPSVSKPNDRGLRLEISSIVVKDAWAHRAMSGAPPLDVAAKDFAAALLVTPDAVEGDVAHAVVTARRIAQGRDLSGTLVAHGRRGLAAPSPTSGRLQWQGLVGGIAHSIRATLDDGKVDAYVDAPRVDSAALRSMGGPSLVDQVATVHAEAHGTFPRVDGALHATLGPAAVDVTAHASLEDDKRVQVRFESRAIDLHQLSPSAPASRLAVTGDVVAAQTADGALSGNATFHVSAGSIGAYGLPPGSLEAKVSRTPSGEWTGTATLSTQEPALPTRLLVSLAPHGTSPRVGFELRSDAADLDAVPELRHSVHGAVHLRAYGALDTSSMRVAARVQARAVHLAQGATRADALSLDVRAEGAVANPRIDGSLRSQGVLVGGRLLSRADVALVGNLMSAHVEAALRGPRIPDVEASGNVSVAGGFSVGKMRIVLTRPAERALVTAERVNVGGGSITVERMVVAGVGAPMETTLSVGGGGLRVVASTTGLDLARVGRLARLEKTLKSGTLSFDVDVDVRTSAAAGRATIDLTGGALGSVAHVAAHIDARMAGRSLTGRVHAEGSGIGAVDLDASALEVAGRGPLLSASWRQVWGEIGIDARADLGKAIALLPPDAVFLDEASGSLVVRGHIARARLSDTHPEVDLSMSTDHLVLSPKTAATRDIDGVWVMARPPWRLEGIDFDVHGTTNAQSGRIELDTRAKDGQGEIVRLRASSNRFPYEDLFGDPGRLSRDLQNAPIELQATMPERGLSGLPNLLKQNLISGRLAFDATLRGSMRSPQLDLALTLKKSHFEDNAHNEFIDFDMSAHYDGSHGTASIAGTIGGHAVVTFESEADAAVAQIIDSGTGATWSASARANFQRLPLEAIPAVDEKLISGDLSGDFTLTNLHENAEAHAKLTVSALKMGSYTYPSALLDLDADGRTIEGHVRVEQTDGFAEAKGRATASWGAALAPVLAADEPLDATLIAKNFRIAALSALVEGSFDEFDGRIDADTHAVLDPKARDTKVSGTVALSQGLFEAAAGGGEFHDVDATMRLTPGTITIDKLSARGLTGHLQAAASARLDHMRIQSAAGVVVIPPGAPIPVNAGGAEIGAVDGRFDIAAKTLGADRGLAITVDVPHIRVALPNRSTTSAISLGPMDRVRLGAHRGHPATFVLLPIDPAETQEASSQTGTKIRVDTRLEDADVVRGTDVKIGLTGQVHVAGGSPTEVTGRIDLKPGGLLSLQGKTFTVESGTVTMVGPDPSNPQVVVKAAWTAPDGTTVFANFVGPLKTGKVTLTSEPALSQEEIVQLLMFGTSDGQQAQNPSADPTLSALSTAGGEAAQPLNHMLNQLGLGAVSVQVDNNQSSTPKPEVEVQIARDISLQIAVVLGQPPPGVNPDTTLLTVDWRFLQRWSFAATVGDAGTTIFDLLWHKRY